MDNLLIGALELSGQPERYGDGVLEAAQLATTQYGCLPPTIGCPPTLRCHIDDGVLEAIGAELGPPATLPRTTCFQTRMPSLCYEGPDAVSSPSR